MLSNPLNNIFARRFRDRTGTGTFRTNCVVIVGVFFLSDCWYYSRYPHVVQVSMTRSYIVFALHPPGWRLAPQEVRRREAAEAEVSEAQGYLKSSRQELGELRHLAWKLEQMGRKR